MIAHSQSVNNRTKRHPNSPLLDEASHTKNNGHNNTQSFLLVHITCQNFGLFSSTSLTVIALQLNFSVSVFPSLRLKKQGRGGAENFVSIDTWQTFNLLSCFCFLFLTAFLFRSQLLESTSIPKNDRCAVGLFHSAQKTLEDVNRNSLLRYIHL